jgi:ATP-dependent Clp protease ATP-binding subunit ClpC
MTPLDPTLLKEARGSRDRLLELQRDLEKARADYNHAVRRLHAEGGSLREIAEDLGLSHQRVHQIVDSGEEGASGRRGHGARRGFGWPFERFTRRSRQIIVAAQGEADALGHGRVGTEHLLLGLLTAGDESVAPVLADAGVTYDAAREKVAALEFGQAKRRMPFTRAAKRSLEQAVRQAQALGDTYIGAEHVLLGLVADERAGAVAILRELGADPDAIRAAVLERRAAA